MTTSISSIIGEGNVSELRKERRLTIYRDDSTAQVVYERVKTHFWTAGNSVLVVSRFDGSDGGAHHYIHWPRERFCWFKDEPSALTQQAEGK